MVIEPKAPKGPLDLRIVTYNIHRCRGMDRRVMPSRIIDVLREVDADVIALQEVIGAGPMGAGQAEEIGAGLGMAGDGVGAAAPQPAARQRRASWQPVTHHACCGARAARARQRVDLGGRAGRTLHVYNAHSALRCGCGATRRRALPRIGTTGASRPKIISGTSEDARAATRTLSSLKSIDIMAHLRRRCTARASSRPPRPSTTKAGRVRP
jgi:hypothetical protein